ncbi:translocation/assembly module TamB domain-containing protein [Mucilaginibacter sabulilitoris]|uniref:Translocation/assembly module TamB domain-containing protein n=1 Tax=Mucilaginibacter sabulilitoris TaxID=1173583 RepID=A0ABZ0TSX7_9SPHI|nr:translocation/assembly module TamB domain-containing protein [Mucilaginibacter sabulilitoris]WPU95871.1 translocation/assembly module TamB domain-containing protein [Mucilaginibacter sabulilitoris]
MKKFGRIALKTILWIIASVIFLVLLVVILIQVPAVQNFAKDKAVNFLQGKIHTKVQIGHISLGLPKLLVLQDVYFEDQKKDTLIAGDNLKVDISLFKLLHNKVEINEINLQGITANVSRGADSVFNFDYIIKAFVGEQKKEVKPEDTTSTMKFSLDKIILDRINIKYKDLTTGNDVRFLLGHFDTRIKDFDMDKMKFTIPRITLSDVNARIIQTPAGSSIAQAAAVDTATTPLNMDLNLGVIDVSKIKVDYQSSEMTANVNLNKFLVNMDKVDLKNQKVGIQSIELNDTKAALSLAKPKTVQKAITKTAKKLDTLMSFPQTSKWAVTLGKVSFTNDNIKFDNEAQKAIPKGLDFGHMDMRNLNAEAENISYSPDTISGKINSFSFNEKSGLKINKFHTVFFYGPTNAYMNDLLLETPQTVLQKSVQVRYPSIDAITKNIGALGINANLDGSRLGLKDVLLLMPTMATMEPFKSSPGTVFKINGKVRGQVNNLEIPNLEVTGLSSTHIKASAKMKGLPDVNKAYFDINIADFTTSRTDIAKLAPAGSIPPNVSIPEKMNLKGTFKGGMTDFDTKMGLRSSYGTVDLIAAMKNGKHKGAERYTASIKANDLNVGALTKQPQMVGKITMSADLKGVSLDPKKASIRFNGNLKKAYVKGYTYQNLVMKGTSSNGNYTILARMKDPNINFNVDAKANLNKKYPSVNGTLLIDSINLQKLNFVKDDMRFHGKLIANVPTADPDYLNADILATDLLVVNKGQRIQLDTVSLKSTANADSSTLRLKTPIMTAHMAGKYKLTQIGDAMQDVVNKYFNTAIAGGQQATVKSQKLKVNQKNKPTTDHPPLTTRYSPQQFVFDAKLVKTPLLTQFVPDLKELDPVQLKGSFNSQSGELVVNGSAPKVVYGTNTVDNVKLDINTANNALNYNFGVDKIRVGSSLELLYTSLSGKAQDNKLDISLQVRDAEKKERYRIAGLFSILPNQYQFSFAKDGLLLDYLPWTANADNYLQYGPKGILAHNFTITNANQVLSVNSNPQEFNAPITVNFNNFRIEALTKMAKQDSLLVGGVIDGKAEISNLQKSPLFTAAIDVHDFNFKGDTVGNIALKVNNQTENAYAASMSITGKGNQVDLTGMYYTSPESRFDMNLNIVNLSMKSIEGFSFGSLRNSSGNITGQLKIAGTTTAPAVRGDIHFNKVGFNVAMLNSYFRMPQESITFNDEGIRFNDFTLVDSTNNKAVISGSIFTKTYTDFAFGLDINARNFRVMNSTQADNKLYYGKLFMDTRVKIRGNMDKPVVDANLTVNEKTDMTIVLPTTDPSVEDRKGVVEFIDQNAPKLDSILLAKQLDSLKKSDVTGMDVSANIIVNKNAAFTIVIDESNGDVVHLKGEANLNGGIDPSGKTNLTGTYVVNSGSYELSYATVKRKFNFKQGSTIVWTGDPTSANIDLTAIYVANVPPIDLVENQIDATNSTMYKQKLPFNVNLKLKNQLLTPDISFDIILPDSNYTVSSDVTNTVNTRLAQVRQDPNEMNKQVLGVLVLGHFIGDNPLQSQGAGTSVEGIVRNSVSSLLSDQLNRLAGNLIEGVDLNFGLTSGEDYSSGTATNRTDLNVGISKRFLNDRLTVSVGNNFNLEGNQQGQKASNIAGDVSVNYKLSKDGRYALRAYRRDEFIVIQGQIIETGLGFTLTVDYNRFKEIFRKRTREERQLRQRYKEQEKAKKKAQDDAAKAHDDAIKTEEQRQPEKKQQTTTN